jgi:alkanesulfonate monooxygenase SsuD/methylene tetrahydromethanopterin reductase-like flavin-dependent oxidoreductase (luciferase family)
VSDLLGQDGGRRVPASVRFDVFLLAGQFPGTSHREALRNALSYAETAEAAGFDGVWIAEHHFLSYGVCPSAVAFAAHVLGRTSRIRVGTAACVLPARHPVALGEEAVLLSELSGGRLDLGVGRGGPWVDLEVFGTGLSRYSEGFPESLDLLLRWLSGVETVAGSGTFPFREVPVVPRPSAPVPVWVAATSTPTVELAAARGLPLLTGMHATDAEKRALIDQHGASDLDHASAHLAYVADTLTEAEGALRAAMPAWLASTREYVRIDGSTPAERDLDAYLERLMSIHPVGPPDLCRERLAATIATTGAKRILLMVEGAGDPELTRANIQRLGADVVAALRGP